jgi:glycosyltransferase involved in cell wall biosynthesis
MILSVVMPLIRVHVFLIETLMSIQAQTFKDFELVIVCDTEIFHDVSKLLKSGGYSFDYKIIQTALRGFAFAVNLGIAASSGKYIARWDSDDLCDPNRFSRQLEEFSKDPRLGVVGTRALIVDEKGEPSQFQKFKYYESNKAIRRALKYRQPLVHSALMFRADVLFRNKGYLYGHTSEDHELFIRIARDKQIYFKNLSDVLTYYRKHSSQLTDVSNSKKHFYEIAGFMFTEFLRTLNPLYLVGMWVNFPPLRNLRYRYRALLMAISRKV